MKKLLVLNFFSAIRVQVRVSVFLFSGLSAPPRDAVAATLAVVVGPGDAWSGRSLGAVLPHVAVTTLVPRVDLVELVLLCVRGVQRYLLHPLKNKVVTTKLRAVLHDPLLQNF